MMELTLDQFARATGAEEAVAARYHDHALAAMERFSIDNPTRTAAFLGTVSVETRQLTAMEEDLYYRDPKRLACLFLRAFDEDHDRAIEPEEINKAIPYCRNPQGLSMRLYNGYHGRGGGQLTWERNYKLHGDKLGYDYVGQPNMLVDPFHAMLSAASFWDEIKANDIAHDMDEVTRRWNGPKRLQLAERIARRDTALQALLLG
jgi:putative chitinase